MSTYYKEGVIGELSPEMARGFRKIKNLFASKSIDLYVTSIREGTHSAGSYHYCGDAVDIRKPPVEYWIRKDEIESTIGNDFDVVYESDHIHIEYDPK